MLACMLSGDEILAPGISMGSSPTSSALETEAFPGTSGARPTSSDALLRNAMQIALCKSSIRYLVFDCMNPNGQQQTFRCMVKHPGYCLLMQRFACRACWVGDEEIGV